jgi:hypothetical protein
MKNLIFILSFLFCASTFAANVYFSTPLSTDTFYIGSNGLAAIPYNMYAASCIYIPYDSNWEARIQYPDGTRSNWMIGEVGGWYVNKAGTYHIEGRAWGVNWCLGTSVQSI